MRIRHGVLLTMVAALVLSGCTKSSPTVASPTITTSPTATASGDCQPGEVPVDLTPPSPQQVTLNVFSGSDQADLAEQLGDELTARGFVVARQETLPADQRYARIATITYGPAGYSAGWLVGALFLSGEAEDVFVPDRTDPAVDLVLGQDFQRIVTPTEVNQRIAALGPPRLRPGTCAR